MNSCTAFHPSATRRISNYSTTHRFRKYRDANEVDNEIRVRVEIVEMKLCNLCYGVWGNTLLRIGVFVVLLPIHLIDRLACVSYIEIHVLFSLPTYYQSAASVFLYTYSFP